jgi:transglutaminase-like putative cysteine protease
MNSGDFEMPLRRVFGWALFCPALALAQVVSSPEHPTHVDDYSSTYVLAADGSFVETRSFVLKVLRAEALAGAKQTSISYSRSIQKAEVLEAYTLKADGRRLEAPKSNYQVTTSGGKDAAAPVFSDQTTLTVVFPDVAVGDSMGISYRVEAIEPMFPNHFSVWEVFQKAQPVDRARVRFDYPESLAIKFDVRQMAQTQSSEQAGRRVVEWSLENPKPAKSKRANYSAFDPEADPGISASTFKSYGEISAAYGARARPKAAVTERIQKLADEIALDKKTPRDSAHALYDWVVKNITYAGNCIGLGAVIPHDLDFVLDNRIGDCKDRATLLEALLAAKAIPSTQALVNAGNIYRLPRLPVAAMVNHVINYIPSLRLYVDSTSDNTPFGMLPIQDEDKTALWVDGYADGMKTPVQPLGSNVQKVKTSVKIGSDGSFSGSAEVALKGQPAVNARAGMRRIPTGAEEDFVKNTFRANGYVASGSFTKGDTEALTDAYRYSATFDVKNMLALPGAGAFPIAPMIASESPIARILAGAIQNGDETDDGACSSITSVEDYVYELPKGMRIVSVPENVTINSDTFSYRATYVHKGSVLTISRVLDDRTKGNVCSQSSSVEARQFALRVTPNIKAQVVFK